MNKKYIAERQDGKIFIISEDEADEAAHNTGSEWHSWDEYSGKLEIGAEVEEVYYITIDDWGAITEKYVLTDNELIQAMFDIAEESPGAIVTIENDKKPKVVIDLIKDEFQDILPMRLGVKI